MERRVFGAELYGLPHFAERLLPVSRRCVQVGQQGVGVSIVGTFAEDKLDLFAGLIELVSCQQQVAQICMGLPIARCKIYCARELRVRPGPHPQLQKALGKLKMR